MVRKGCAEESQFGSADINIKDMINAVIAGFLALSSVRKKIREETQWRLFLAELKRRCFQIAAQSGCTSDDKKRLFKYVQEADQILKK